MPNYKQEPITYVYDRNGKLCDADFSGIHQRCTNFTLKAFGINVMEVIQNNHHICSILKRHGYEIIDLGYLADKQDDLKEAVRSGSGLVESPFGNTETNWNSNKWSGKYYNWEKLSPYLQKKRRIKTVNNVMQEFASGRFIIGTPGHSMGYVDGKLYDFAAKGPSRARVDILQLVLKETEFRQFIQSSQTYFMKKSLVKI